MIVRLEGEALASSCVSPIREKMLKRRYTFTSNDIEFDSKQIMTE